MIKENNKQKSLFVGLGILLAVVIIIAIAFFIVKANTSAFVKVEEGDKVSIKYVGKYQNGTIFDTNYLDVGQNAGLHNFKTEPLEFTAGSTGIIKGVSDAVLGMKKGQKKTVEIPPEEAYGEYDLNKVGSFPLVRYAKMDKYIPFVVDLDEATFEQGFNTTPKQGSIVKSGIAPWSYDVEKVESGRVVVKARVELGDTFVMPGMPWPSEVTAINDTHFTIRYMPIVGGVISTDMGPSNVSIEGDDVKLTLLVRPGDSVNINGKVVKVTSVDDENFYIDTNHPMAGKTLVFDLEVVDIQKKEE